MLQEAEHLPVFSASPCVLGSIGLSNAISLGVCVCVCLKYD